MLRGASPAAEDACTTPGLRKKWNTEWFQLQGEGTELAQYDREGGKQKDVLQLCNCRRVNLSAADDTIVELFVETPSSKVRWSPSCVPPAAAYGEMSSLHTN
eukprot:SAG11_NODE_1631_length_4544_cov_3.740832_3_plen_102_part_00